MGRTQWGSPPQLFLDKGSLAVRTRPQQEDLVSRRTGERIAGRWEVGPEVVGTRELRRYRLTDLQSGETLELSELRTSVGLHPGADRAFLKAITNMPQAPAAMPCVPITTDKGTACISHVTAGTLADREFSLTADQVLDLCRWLAPAILAPGSPHQGRLRPEDIVLDDAGVPRLLPTGLPAGDATLEIPFFAAPEVLRGRAPKPASGLYGLGVILYRALTGSLPLPARSSRERRRRPQLPAPASRLAPDTPPMVDELLAGLLHKNPARRVRAVRDLQPWQGAGPGLELPAPTPTPERTAALTVAVPPAPLQSAAPHAAGPHLVIASLDGVPPAGRHLVALRSNISTMALERASQRRQDVVLASMTLDDARDLVDRLAVYGIPAEVRRSASKGRGLFLVLGLSAILAAAITLGFSAIIALVLAVLGLGMSMLAISRPPAALRRGPPPMVHRNPAIAAMQRRIAGLTIRLLKLPLPEPMARDLRDELYRLQERVLSLAGAREGLARSLRSLRDPEAGDPLRRSLGDIDAEFDDMGDVLDALEATLMARPDKQPSEDAVVRITKLIDAVRATRIELGRERGPEG